MELPSENQQNFRDFSKLPVEIISIIFDYLDIVSKLRLRRVSRKWNSILENCFETIKMEEQSCKIFLRKMFLREGYPLHAAVVAARRKNQDSRSVVSAALVNCIPADLWKGVKCVIIEGDYDWTDDKPHAGDNRFPEAQLFISLARKIVEAKKEDCESFKMLNTVVVRRIALNLGFVDYLVKAAQLRCRLIMCESTLAVEKTALYSEARLNGLDRIEFAIDKCKVFDLSGEVVYLVNAPDLHICRDENWMCLLRGMERVMAGFIVEQCNAVKDEDVSRLGELYSSLLRGREGMVIREEVRRLFNCFFERDAQGKPHARNNRSPKHWQQSMGYDCKSLDKVTKFMLVYYTNPRTCYRVAHGNPRKIDRFQEPNEL